jgi:DMSO/TMAO reductase YedYZ molybdopterin-dependent catalytic subunit
MGKWTRRDVLRLGVHGAAMALLAACGSKQGTEAPLTVSPGARSPTSTPKAKPAATATDAPVPTEAEAPSPIPTLLSPQEPSPDPQPTAPPFDYESDVTITSVEDFYTVTYHPQPPPAISESDFRLRVFGAVDNELNLSLDDLLAMPVIEEMRTLECISNPVGGDLISNAVWRGVRTSELLQRAGVSSRAIELKFECADGYDTSIPVDLAMGPHSFLAYWMNGAPLPPEHGFPVRALWPGRYGQKQPKWITGIELITQPHLGHWERQGWSNEAIIVPNSRIDQPKKTDVVALPATVSGIAFANASGVEKIEISTDDGANWHNAELIRGPSTRVWTEWRFEWREAEPGSHVLRARVTDGEGRRQRSGNNRLLGGIKPDGTDLQHSIAVTVKRS